MILYFQTDSFSTVQLFNSLINTVTDGSLINEPVFPSHRVALLSWAVDAMPSCHVCSCLWSLMPRLGEISCRVFPSQLSASGFINHAWLNTGERLPFSWGLRHLWQRPSSLLWDRIRKRFMSEARLTGAHCGRLMSLSLKFDGNETLTEEMGSLLRVGSKVHLLGWQQQGRMLREDV